MTEPIIDLLKSIQIDEAKTERVVVTHRGRHFLMYALEAEAAVVEVCEMVELRGTFSFHLVGSLGEGVPNTCVKCIRVEVVLDPIIVHTDTEIFGGDLFASVVCQRDKGQTIMVDAYLSRQRDGVVLLELVLKENQIRLTVLEGVNGIFQLENVVDGYIVCINLMQISFHRLGLVPARIHQQDREMIHIIVHVLISVSKTPVQPCAMYLGPDPDVQMIHIIV